MTVIGASAGCVDALRSIVAAIIVAAIFGVLHIGTHRNDRPAGNGRDGDAIEPGLITVAPPDQHMILDNIRVVMTRGAREARARPALDPHEPLQAELTRQWVHPGLASEPVHYN